MEHYRHILAAVDFSDSTDAVAGRAVHESRLHSSRLTLMHVTEYYPEDVPPGLVPAENLDPVQVYLQRSSDRLARLADTLGVSDAGQVAVANDGAAYHEIVRFAEDHDVDLIVMGYAGRWVTHELGSTAMAVTRHVVCDVLLVRPTGGS